MLRIGEIYRYSSKNKNPDSSHVDGLPNYYHVTHTPSANLPLLEAGINPIGKVSAVDGTRCPAILISSSPHKIGYHETPWQDFFDPDNGHIHYFGDNKEQGKDPSLQSGNKVLLEQYEIHNATEYEARKKSVPIIFFKRVSVHGRAKGNVQFQGFGIVSSAQRVTQYNHRNKQSFTNYVFDFTVLSLADENEMFDWKWLSDRRDKALSIDDTLTFAPKSWQKWLKHGQSVVESCKRRVSKLLTLSSNEQQPLKGSREDRALQDIYNYYSTESKKHRFEALASLVASELIKCDGGTYHEGWITPSSSDGGADFIGRLDVGSDFSKTKIIVLGQAKCEKMTSPTGGNHIARTVARLKRGWIGAYVTTSYFSESVQREVIEDKYPVLLVNGLRLAKEVLKLSYNRGYETVLSFLEEVDKTYDSKVMARDPEEILYD